MAKERILGIDYGLKKIGLALSDERQIIASPWMNLIAEKTTEGTIAKLLAEIKAYEKGHTCTIGKIVIGLPLMMSGHSSFLSDEVMHFIHKLKEVSPIPIFTWDERLTSVQADRVLRDAQFTRKRRSMVIDVVTAVIILQNFLDAQSGPPCF